MSHKRRLAAPAPDRPIAASVEGAIRIGETELALLTAVLEEIISEGAWDPIRTPGRSADGLSE